MSKVKTKPYKMSATTSDGGKVQYSVDLSRVDWGGIANLISGLWKPGKWKKLAVELIALVREVWEDVVALLALVRDLGAKLDEILGHLKDQEGRLKALEGSRE